MFTEKQKKTRDRNSAIVATADSNNYVCLLIYRLGVWNYNSSLLRHT